VQIALKNFQKSKPNLCEILNENIENYKAKEKRKKRRIDKRESKNREFCGEGEKAYFPNQAGSQ
jgi:hypothetical protein